MANTVDNSFDISDYITDAKAESEGVWRSIGKDGKGRVREIKLARLNNDDYNSFLRRKQRANQPVLEQQDDDAFKLAEDINKEALARTIIKGLRVNGQEVPYTVELGLELLKNRDFHAKVNALAGQMDAYKEHSEEDLGKS